MSDNILVVGGSRGLGLELVKHFTSSDTTPTSNTKCKVFTTVRSSTPEEVPKDVNVIEGIDLNKEDCAHKIVEGLGSTVVDKVFITAGLLETEDFDKLNWQGQINMYTICAIAPVFIIQALVKAKLLKKGSKVVYFTSEGGSIALRTEEEGGGMYGHHGSKAASNMVGHLLAIDLKPLGIPLFILHPGFMKTEMTANAFGKEAWDHGGALHPKDVLPNILNFINDNGMEESGQFWAPNGPGDIGQAENVIGKNLPTPLQIPW